MNTKAAQDVLAERERQKTAEGWTEEHDDQHKDGQLADAAAAYAVTAAIQAFGLKGMPAQPTNWPWADEWWKPRDARRNLVRAGALIIAEIERLDRAAGASA